jgi:DNA-binding NarL/FixJ family response regulator
MHKIKVLIVDDHTLFREGIELILNREQDIECVGIAEDGESAVRLAGELEPDVIVMDIVLPKINGIEATKKIKSLYPNISIIMLSAHKSESYIIESTRANADGYLLKSIPRAHLINAIRVVFAGGSVFDKNSGAVVRKITSRKRNGNMGYYDLCTREIEVLELVAKGMTNKEIGQRLKISDRTVGTYFASIFRKLGVRSRTEAALHAFQQHIINFEPVESNALDR